MKWDGVAEAYFRRQKFSNRSEMGEGTETGGHAVTIRLRLGRQEESAGSVLD